MSLYDTVVQRWRANLPSAAVDQFLAEQGAELRDTLDAAERRARDRRSLRAFQQWVDQQVIAGRDFDEVQLRWLDWMRQDIAARGELTLDHLGQGPYAQAGGADRAARIFGRRTLGDVVAGLNATLGWKRDGCGCGGTCGVSSGGCGCKGSPKAPTEDAPDDALRAAYYARRFEDELGYPMPPPFAEIVLRHVTSLHTDLAPLERTLDDRNALPQLVSLATELIRTDRERPWSVPEDPERAAMRAAVARLVATLPRPDLAPLRSWTTRQSVTPGSLVVLPLDPETAEQFPPEDRYALTLHLPNGRGFMFSFGQLADPGLEDLSDLDRQWEWDDDPHEVRGVPVDTDAVVLARDLDWADIGALLGFELEGEPR